MSLGDDLIWEVRAFIYAWFADRTQPPRAEDTAQHFGLAPEQAGALYRELHERHAIFLEPGTLSIRMAFPFSGVPTDFRVRANGKTYYANCAWDMLGIPAALHSEAAIHAVCAESGEPLGLEVRQDRVAVLAPTGGGSQVKIHFAVPFSRWYDDLVHT
ncbi:MAG: organomercurial lyase [Bacteroidota bacterium]